MQRKSLVVLAVAACALMLGGVGLLLVNNVKLAQRERDRARMEAALAAEHAARAQQLDRERTHLAQQNEELAKLATALRQNEVRQDSNLTALSSRLTNLATQGQSSTTAANPKQAMSEMMEKMMSDPAMREMVRTQQKSALNQMYGPLFRELSLNPEQKQQFLDVLLDQMMSGMTNASGLFGGQGPRADALQAIKEQEKEMQAKLKQLLGDERYGRYEDYQKSVNERMMVNSLRQQMDESPTPLRDEQSAQLLAIMREEKARVPPVIPSTASSAADALQALGSDEAVSRQLQWQEDYHHRLVERAKQVLTPEQMKAYEEFLQSQLAMQKMGMKMARDMFGDGQPNPASQPQSIPAPAK
jgi:hypothetical protein